jgi:hypothetical protein
MGQTMATRDQILDLFDLADRKGHDVTQSTMRDHVRLIDTGGNLVKNTNGGAAFSYAEARRYLEGLLVPPHRDYDSLNVGRG